MTIHCKVCNWPIKSLNADLASESQVMRAMAEHLGHCHPEEARNLASEMLTLQMAITTYLLLKHYVRIPPEETTMLEAYRENEEALANLFATVVD